MINNFHNELWNNYVNIYEVIISTNLGCSRKNSSETLEGWRRKGFQDHCVWSCVSRFWEIILKDIIKFLFILFQKNKIIRFSKEKLVNILIPKFV